jgi:hypothetical protein
VIKMLKHWNRRQPVKLQSYHIEVIALKLATSWTEYSWPIYQWFQSAQSETHFCWLARFRSAERTALLPHYTC